MGQQVLEGVEARKGRCGVLSETRTRQDGDAGLVGRFDRSNAFGWRVYAKLRRAGFRRALWTSMWFQMMISRSGHERMWLKWCAPEECVHPCPDHYVLSFTSEFGTELYHGPLRQPS